MTPWMFGSSASMGDPIASPPKQILRFRDSIAETHEARTFRFDPPREGFAWRPGQNLVMTIPGLEDPRGATRPFTISSSPTEGGMVAVSTLVRESPFKQRLAQLAPGDTVENEAIEGEFVLEAGRPAVMIAGGIGVTPFRSMLRFAVDTRLEKPLVLLYSSKTPQDIVFRAELEEFTRRNHAIRVVHTITRPEEAREPWTGRKGRIDAEMIREGMRGVRHPLVYVAGPPGFVKEARRLIDDELHIGKEDLRIDEFDGY
ncbi:MAG: FAD-dependent oxidoreductase [Thermoplasmata archaeon]|nr:FAD-dependent oxidoreductase [Thermoplasmata archaeon]